jgi:hypothetical protein
VAATIIAMIPIGVLMIAPYTPWGGG